MNITSMEQELCSALPAATTPKTMIWLLVSMWCGLPIWSKAPATCDIMQILEDGAALQVGPMPCVV